MVKPKTIHYRRRREGRTNYHQRLRHLLARKPRLVVRLSNQRIMAQIVQFNPQGDIIVLGTDSLSLKKLGWAYNGKNLPSAYLTGLHLGRKASKSGITEAILDVGLRNPVKKGRVYALLKGVVDAGLNVPYGNEDIFPATERIEGKDIQNYAAQLKKDSSAYQQKFAQYLKNNCPPEGIHKTFIATKEKILKS